MIIPKKVVFVLSGDVAINELLMALIDHIRDSSDENNSVFAMEARYGFQNKRADFLYLSEKTHAFELKSDFDSVVHLSEQLHDYIVNFDFVSAVATPKLMKKIRGIAPQGVGLILYENHSMRIIRKPRQNKRLSKLHLARSCTKNSLIEALPWLSKKSNSSDIADKAAELLTIAELRAISISNYRARFSKSSKVFTNEANKPVRETDLSLLKRSQKISFS